MHSEFQHALFIFLYSGIALLCELRKIQPKKNERTEHTKNIYTVNARNIILCGVIRRFYSYDAQKKNFMSIDLCTNMYITVLLTTLSDIMKS